MYKIYTSSSVIRIEDGSIVPFADGNRDYLEYLNWLADGNKPLPLQNNAPPVPDQVSMRQARLALLKIDRLDILNKIVDGCEEEVKIAWEYSNHVKRIDPVVAYLAKRLELISEEIDDLFIMASQL